jgi:hypothetical protein
VEHPPRLEDHKAAGYNRLLGLAYRKVRNRVIEGLQLVKTVDSPGHGSRWMVRDYGGGGQGRSLSTTVGTPSDLGGCTRGTTGNAQQQAHGKNTINIRSSACDVREKQGPTGEGTTDTPVIPRVEEPGSLADAPSPPRLAPVLPLYPRYPSTDGADPLASLLDLAEQVPAPRCLDCDAEEELVPGSFWFACRACTPATFDSRS